MQRHLVAMMTIGLLSSPSIAEFTGTVVGEHKVGELCVADLYITFSQSGEWVNSIFSTSFTLGAGGFASLLHNDSAGGVWAPQLTVDAEVDTFVTIGGSPGSSNYTSLHPLWHDAIGSDVVIPTGAGWFNSNPPSLQGLGQVVTLTNVQGALVYEGYATLVARLVFADPGPVGKPFSIAATCGWNVGIGGPPTQFDSVNYSGNLFAIPAPAMTVGLVAVLVMRSRRRRL
ncbi:MAG: hypothetical protein SGJ11_00355 [Phycisphaerae bacterium]|nr:hypothetical protein [Phycisphaerae bacterium]